MLFSSAILLAAGKSERFGGLKQAAQVSGVPMVRKSATSLLEGGVREVIVVAGHRATEVVSALGRGSWRVVMNEQYREGMGSSIRAGAAHVSAETGVVLVALSDLPGLRGETIGEILRSYEGCGKGILVPVHLGRRGHPVCFNPKYLDELRKLTGDSGARELLERYKDDLFLFETGTDSIYSDVDTAIRG